MDSPTRREPSIVPVELLKEILAHCTKSDLARASMANSQFLEISRDSLYSKIYVWGDATLTPILPALRNPKIAQRLRHVLLDPNYDYQELSHFDEFIGIISTVSLIRLDLIAFMGMGYAPHEWMTKLLVRLSQLQQLQYLGLSMVFFVNVGLYIALHTSALRDIDISEVRLLRNMQPSVDKVSEPSRLTPLPILDTLRIRNSAAHWRNLLNFLDLKHMKRLGVWDFEQEIGDLANEWGGLVTVSAPSLEMLSLWLTSNIIDKDIPKYLQSISGFPNLHTLALFLDIFHVDNVPTILWMDIFPLIIRSFYICSPSLRHIRLHPHNWNATYTYDELLKDQHFAQFAREVAGLKNLETIELYLRSSQPPSANDHDTKLVRLAGMFHPVHLLIQYGVPWNLAWPFFADDRQDAEWTKILTRP